MPQHTEIRGKLHTLCVLQVLSKNADGTPRTLKLLGEDEQVSVKNEPEFITGFLMTAGIQPDPETHL